MGASAMASKTAKRGAARLCFFDTPRHLRTLRAPRRFVEVRCQKVPALKKTERATLPTRGRSRRLVSPSLPNWRYSLGSVPRARRNPLALRHAKIFFEHDRIGRERGAGRLMHDAAAFDHG